MLISSESQIFLTFNKGSYDIFANRYIHVSNGGRDSYTYMNLRLKYENYVYTDPERSNYCVGTTRAVKTDLSVFTTPKCSNGNDQKSPIGM